MQRTSPPFRAEHIGSIKRPAELMQARAEYASGSTTLQNLRRVEDEAIMKVLELQRSAGIKTFTDGEFRREFYFEGVYDQLEGMEVVLDSPPEYFTPFIPAYEALAAIGVSYICKSKLRRKKCLYERDFMGLKKLVKPEEVGRIKLTMCCPELCHLQHGPYTYEKGVYADDEQYFADIARIYQEEIKDLYNLGCRNIQIDESYLAFFCDESMIRGMQDIGIDPDARLDRYIRLLNDCLRGRPKDMNAGIHLCRGNTKDGFARGGYARIAAKLFQGVEANCFYLEYDTIRAGGFEPLKYLPSTKLVVLGLVSTRTPELEDPEKLRDQIHEAAKMIADGQRGTGKTYTEKEALNQICISPQCGFSSISQGTHATVEEDIRKKLLLVVQVAKSVWEGEA